MSLALALLLACGGAGETAPAPALARPRGPSILVVTLDTTRADRVGAYGHEAAHTPNIDRVAARGLRFDRAYATAALTIPSHSSIFTGRYPPSHGVRDNGDFVLSDAAVTLAERFEQAGWSTAAFTAAFPTQRRWGLAQGFQHYHDPLEALPDDLDWSHERTADQVIDDAIATLPELRGPVFVWVHLFDPHWPYRPPAPWSDRLASPYDGEIAFADHELGRLLRDWDRWFPDGIVAITADHGEGHGEGGELTHGFLLHDATIRVPLVLAGPGVEVGVTDDPVSHVDLAPTLLTLAGLSLHDGLQGHDLRAGGSEAPYQEALAGRYHLGLAELSGQTDDSARFVRGAWDGVYQRTPDGIPTAPTSRSDPSRAARLDDLLSSLETAPDAHTTLDQVAMQQLLALGYVGSVGGEAGDIDPRDVIDVIPLSWEVRRSLATGNLRQAALDLSRLEQRMPEAHGVRLLRALWLVAAGRPGTATQVFTDLFLTAPSSMLALELASLAEVRGDLRDAEDWYDEALALQPDSPEALLGLVRTAWLRGEHSEAQVRATEALLTYPDHAEVGLLRAELALQDRRLGEALADAEVAVARLPGEARALALLARIRWELGDANEALDLLLDAILFQPDAVPPRVLGCRWLLEVGRNAEALRLIEPVAVLEPDWPDVARLHREARASVIAERRMGKRER